MQSVYYYYPFKSAHAKSFNSFYDDICTAVSLTTSKQNGEDGTANQADKFSWLQNYRRENDESAIDRSIADGTITLKRRESKFREELERHEFEYIVHKDFKYAFFLFGVFVLKPNA